ncbi:MAG: hypothetical protein ACE5OZ_10590 [Candidatus Heimdallarchaeota archaeon]
MVLNVSLEIHPPESEGLILKNYGYFSKAMGGYFQTLWVNQHPFQRINGKYKNPYLAMEYAEKLGFGIRQYELVEVLSVAETMEAEPPKGVAERAPTFF